MTLSLAHDQDATERIQLEERVKANGIAVPAAGVNVVGYLRTESGVGSAVRAYLRALHRLQMPVALCDVSDLQTNRSEDCSIGRFDATHPHDINLVCADVELHYAIMTHVGEEFFANRYNVGIWAWEQPGFPQKWYDRFAWYDEIWVASSFIANALTPVCPLPVVCIPPVLTVDKTGCREAGRRRLGVAPEEFVCLFIFDFHSHAERKNPLAVIKAFQRAFGTSESARLVLKCVNAESKPEDFARIKQAAQGHAIDIYSGYWPYQEVRDLMAACDVYVSLHRSEGTGLTITDAMALGKPVIATGWSGNMDFMTVSNSFPVRYELVELAENVGPYRAGELWAEPEVEHAAELIRWVYEHRAEAAVRGQRAQRDLECCYSETAIGELIAQRLKTIAIRRRFPEFRQEIKNDYKSYCQLPKRIRITVHEILPADARVLRSRRCSRARP